MKDSTIAALFTAVVMIPVVILFWFAWQHDEGIKRECRDRGGVSVDSGFGEFSCLDAELLEDRP